MRANLRIHIGAIVLAIVIPTSVFGANLPPGGDIPLVGVPGGAGPGTVLYDELIPFEIRGTGGALLFAGRLQDRVVRVNATQTLSFNRQIRDTVDGLNGVVGSLVCTGFGGFLTDVEYSLTSTGSIGPDRGTRSVDGSAVFYHFERSPLFSGATTRFVHAKTEASDFTDGGRCAIRLRSGEEVVLGAVSPVRRVEPGCRTIDFEDLAVGTTVPAGGAFTSSGVLLRLHEFYWDVGTCTNPTLNGFVSVGMNGMACGGGRELMVNNVNVEIDYGVPLTDLVVHFGEYGGNINLQVNGHCVSASNFSDLPPVVGGVDVFVDEAQPGQGCGKLTLHGAIGTVSLGGQEFWIDDIECTPDVCADDDTPPVAELHEPAPLACVCDPVDIFGTASDQNFDHYVLEVRAVSDPTWTTIATGFSPVIGGLLGMWNTTGLAQGRYLIRLTVRDVCGHSDSAVNLVWLGTEFDTLTVREPDPGEVIGGNACVDGTVWDAFCFGEYTVDYQRPGGTAWSPVDPARPVYTGTVINDPIAHWDTLGLGIPDGPYLLRVVGSDDCGNVAREVVDVVVDNTPPHAEITDPLPCSYVEGLVRVVGTAFDENLSSWVLQYTGGDASGWVTINSSNAPVVDDVLGLWDTTPLRPCAYTLRLVVVDRATLNCNHTSHHRSEYTVSVNVGACGDFDTDDDGDVDLFDFFWFEDAFTGPLP